MDMFGKELTFYDIVSGAIHDERGMAVESFISEPVKGAKMNKYPKYGIGEMAIYVDSEFAPFLGFEEKCRDDFEAVINELSDVPYEDIVDYYCYLLKQKEGEFTRDAARRSLISEILRLDDDMTVKSFISEPVKGAKMNKYPKYGIGETAIHVNSELAPFPCIIEEIRVDKEGIRYAVKHDKNFAIVTSVNEDSILKTVDEYLTFIAKNLDERMKRLNNGI